MEYDYDVGIVGAGVAGMTAAMYAARGGLSVICLEKEVQGGQIITSPEVENYPGIDRISGAELANALYQQASKFGVKIEYDEVKSAELTGDIKVLHGAAADYRVRGVVLAGGVERRKLGCPGEDLLVGRGVSYCATCDGAFYKGHTVAVVGGGNTAVEDALALSALCEKVYVIHRRQGFRAAETELAKLRNNTKVEFVLDSVVTEIRGKDKVESLLIKSTAGGPDRELVVDGLFVAIGLIPQNKAFAGQIALTDEGYVDADESCTTSLPRVWVAGDTRKKALRQLATAAADGAIAGSAAVAALAGDATL